MAIMRLSDHSMQGPLKGLHAEGGDASLPDSIGIDGGLERDMVINLDN